MKHTITFLLAAAILLASCNQNSGSVTETTGDAALSLSSGEKDAPLTDPPLTEAPTPAIPTPQYISFYPFDDVEYDYIWEDAGSNNNGSDDRFCDAHRYIVYAFPTGGNATAELELMLKNQYELSVSSDDENYEVLDSSLEYNVPGERKTHNLDRFTGGKYIYVKIGDADISDGWGGLLPHDMPVVFKAGDVPAVTIPPTTERARGDIMLKTWDLQPGSDNELSFIVSDSSLLRDGGALPYRLCEATREVIYKFEGRKGQAAFISFTIGQEYVVSLSSDGEHYTEVLNFYDCGRSSDRRSVDLTPFFAESDSVYMKVADAIPETGWGPQIAAMTYTEVTGGESMAGQISINDGWTANDAPYTAGSSISADAVTFRREVEIPASMIGNLAVSFACIEATDATVKINGKEAEMLSGSGNILCVAIPEDAIGAGSFTLEVETTASADRICGLWSNVRLGYADLISYPQITRSLDSEVRPLTYAELPYDLVKLNALSGNFLQSLYNKELGINSFSTDSERRLYYVGDTARALISLAYEEIYSPIVRLEYAMGIYTMVKGALVPENESMAFLKYDARPKRVTAEGDQLIWKNVQDVVEPFAGMRILPNGADSAAFTQTAGGEENYNGHLNASFDASGASVKADITWYEGTSDKATAAKLTPEGCKSYKVVIELSGGYHGDRRYTGVALSPDDIRESSEGELPASNSYFAYTGRYWHTNGVLITTTTTPIAAERIKGEGGEIKAIILTFEGDAKPTVYLNAIEWTATDLKYPFYLAENLLKEGKFGTNGYDPSYICDHSLGALAAGAYLTAKYDPDNALDAIKLAAETLITCDENISSANAYVPDYWESAISGCELLVRAINLVGEEAAGYKTSTFIKFAEKWANRNADSMGTAEEAAWLETRNPVSMLKAYDLTGKEKYRDAAYRYYSRCNYTPEGVIYGSTTFENCSFTGAGDLILMAAFGYENPLEVIMQIEHGRIDDTGFFACSDLNPYYLGYSLKFTMNRTYDAAEKKQILKLGEYCYYDAEGNVTKLTSPTSYINNPLNQ